MAETPLDVLLEETKGLYKAEAERYGSVYGRIGVLMAVFVVLGLIGFRGHLTKGVYGVRHGRREEASTTA